MGLKIWRRNERSKYDTVININNSQFLVVLNVANFLMNHYKMVWNFEGKKKDAISKINNSQYINQQLIETWSKMQNQQLIYGK